MVDDEPATTEAPTVDDRAADDPTDEASPAVAATMTDPYAGRFPPSPAARLGRYELGTRLGAGGMGVVYRARDPELKRDVAIKIVSTRGRGGEQGRVLREAEAMAKLRHPNVVPVFDVGTRDDSVYLVMPLLEGGTLGTWLRAERRFWRDVVERFVAAARGLTAAHALGLVHRDFKPDNVLLGAADEVQVADFGIARVDAAADGAPGDPVGGAASEPLTRVGAVMGTPAYMAPEQLDGAPVDARADQFSFCVALYEGVYGARPFDLTGKAPADLAALRDAIRSGRIRPPAAGRSAPRWLRALIVRGLSDGPAARWPSMAALVVALQRGIGRRRRAALAVGAAAVVAIVSAIVVRGQAQSPSATQEPVWIERPLTARGDISAAALSPDGSQIVAMSGRDLIVVPTSGGETRTLWSEVEAADWFLSWSSDGSRILFYQWPGHEPARHYSIDLGTGARTDIDGLVGMWLELDDGAVVEYTVVAKAISIRRANTAVLRCTLPGGYDWIRRLVAVRGTIYVVLANSTRVGLVAVTPTCSSVRILVDQLVARDIVVRDDARIIAVVQRADRVVLVEYDEDGRPSGQGRPLPVGVDTDWDIPGYGFFEIHSSIGAALLKMTTTWRLFDTAQPRPRVIARGSGYRAQALSPDGGRIAAIDDFPAPGSLRIMRLEALSQPPAPIASGIKSIGWAPDGNRLAVLRRDVADAQLSLEILDVRTAQMARIARVDASNGLLVWPSSRRVAYQRQDHRTYQWIDLVDGTTGTTFDPSRGWTFRVAISPRDATRALYWNRPKPAGNPPGTWLVRPDGTEIRIRDVASELDGHAWSLDGSTLWLYAQDGRIDRYDLATGRTTHVRTLELAANERIDAIFPTTDDRVLVQTSVITTDLAVFGPPR